MRFLFNPASICPMFLIFLSILQSVTFFYSARSTLRGDNDTAFSVHSSLSRDEYVLLFTIHGKVKIFILPIFVVFVFFFSTLNKIIFPILVYALSFVASRIVFIVFRNKYKK